MLSSKPSPNGKKQVRKLFIILQLLYSSYLNVARFFCCRRCTRGHDARLLVARLLMPGLFTERLCSEVLDSSNFLLLAAASLGCGSKMDTTALVLYTVLSTSYVAWTCKEASLVSCTVVIFAQTNGFDQFEQLRGRNRVPFNRTLCYWIYIENAFRECEKTERSIAIVCVMLWGARLFHMCNSTLWCFNVPSCWSISHTICYFQKSEPLE